MSVRRGDNVLLQKTRPAGRAGRWRGSEAVFAPGEVAAVGGGEDGALVHGQAAPEVDLGDAAGGDEALVGVIVRAGEAVVRADDVAGPGIIDHDVRVAAGLEDALFGVEAAEAGGSLRENAAEILRRETPGADAEGVEELAPVLRPGESRGDGGEVLDRKSVV